MATNPALRDAGAMTASTCPTDIQRLLRVNHSGEFGAIGIYQAQRLLARLTWPQGVTLVDEMLQHERGHLARFGDLLVRRGIRSCYALPLWRLGGWLLGALTGLFCRRGILLCTFSVESTVLHHLAEQRGQLAGRDEEFVALIADIEHEERAHRDHGLAYAATPNLPLRAIDALARTATKFAIRLSLRF